MTAEQQRDHALALANQVRIKRAALRREVRGLPSNEGRALVAELLTDSPACLLSMRVVDLVAWPKYGSSVANRFLRAARIPVAARLERTTPRQRAALAACLRGHVEDVETEAAAREQGAWPQSQVAA